MIDYNQQFKQTLAGLKKRESLLLHTCCAVCAGGVLAREFPMQVVRGTVVFDNFGKNNAASASLETEQQIADKLSNTTVPLTTCKKRLADYFDITLYFYNPNIDTQEEYDKRAGELQKLKKAFSIRDIIIAEYKPREFYNEIKGREDGPEGACGRCNTCIGLRLYKAAQCASKNGFERFSTVLSVSPHKSAWEVSRAGTRAQNRYGIPFLPADFKKENGFLYASQTAVQLNLYRQNYCGCVYSKIGD